MVLRHPNLEFFGFGTAKNVLISNIVNDSLFVVFSKCISTSELTKKITVIVPIYHNSRHSDDFKISHLDFKIFPLIVFFEFDL